MSSTSESFSLIVGSVASVLKKAGYRRKGATFLKQGLESIGIINIQRSTKSTRDSIVFTVNVGICLFDLYKVWGSPGSEPSAETDCQVRMRIGHLMPESRDHWWVLAGKVDAATLQNDVPQAIQTYAVPFVDQFLSKDAVVALWKSGKAPGITEQQRMRYLQDLGAAP